MKAVRRSLVPVLSLLAVIAFPVAAAADSVVITHTPVSLWLFNTCRSEPFLAQGFMHVQDHLLLKADGSLHHHLEVNLQNMKGAALSGARYVVTHSESVPTNADSDFAPFTSSFIFKEHYARLGEDGTILGGDDFFIYFRLHLTVNANGTTTVQRLDSDFDCR
jgi:hypothetical protein